MAEVEHTIGAGIQEIKLLTIANDIGVYGCNVVFLNMLCTRQRGGNHGAGVGRFVVPGTGVVEKLGGLQLIECWDMRNDSSVRGGQLGQDKTRQDIGTRKSLGEAH